MFYEIARSSTGRVTWKEPVCGQKRFQFHLWQTVPWPCILSKYQPVVIDGNCRWTKRQTFNGHWSAVIAFCDPNLDEWGQTKLSNSNGEQWLSMSLAETQAYDTLELSGSPSTWSLLRFFRGNRKTSELHFVVLQKWNMLLWVHVLFPDVKLRSVVFKHIILGLPM